MRHWRIWLYLAAMIGILGLCVFASLPPGATIPRAPSQAAVAEVQPTQTVVEQEAQPTLAAAATETQAPEQQPTQPEAAAVEPVDYCVECHADKDHLVNTAAPEEAVVEESEGAG